MKKILGDKSDEILKVQTKKSLWAENSPTDEKFSAVFDANGVETTQESYNHTAQGNLLQCLANQTNFLAIYKQNGVIVDNRNHY